MRETKIGHRFVLCLMLTFNSVWEDSHAAGQKEAKTLLEELGRV